MISEILGWVLLLGFCFLFQSFKFGHWIRERNKRKNLLGKFPGPKGYPLLGNAGELLSSGSDHILDVTTGWRDRYGKCFHFSLGLQDYIGVACAQDAEKIMSSFEFINKSKVYQTFIPWLGSGLILAGDKKWAQKRKLLTPAFHFKILEDSLVIFNEQSKVFVNVLRKFENNEPFDISPFIKSATLDVICESAMGKKTTFQLNSENEYLKAVNKINEILLYRSVSPWLDSDFIWKLTSSGKHEARCLNILHSFTNKIIQERKEERKNNCQNNLQKNPDASFGFGDKRPLAFLDLLLEVQENNPGTWTDTDIREEVDTFMFEGHDTTAAALGWTIFLLGNHPKEQAQVHNELNAIFGQDNSRPVTKEDLTGLKYLELCFKESLRLFPSVPHVSRGAIDKDFKLDSKRVIPAGTSVSIMIPQIQRDPEYFPEPDKFIPERFLTENSIGRHPYAYLPFSAGPRNCIGQKFAMMEVKVVLANLLRNYEIKSIETMEEIKMIPETILRPKNGFNVLLKSRK